MKSKLEIAYDSLRDAITDTEIAGVIVPADMYRLVHEIEDKRIAEAA